MIIGLTGYAQSGKDTLANILIENHGYTRIAFADKIRDFIYAVNPMVEPGLYLKDAVDEMGWDKAKVTITEVRRLLQDIGIGARTIFGSQFWINEAMRSILRSPDTDMRYVITDVRFINEANMIKANNGQIWRVKRNGVDAVNSHVSESEMDNFKVDQIFLNNGSLEDLAALVKSRMSLIK